MLLFNSAGNFPIDRPWQEKEFTLTGFRQAGSTYPAFTTISKIRYVVRETDITRLDRSRFEAIAVLIGKFSGGLHIWAAVDGMHVRYCKCRYGFMELDVDVDHDDFFFPFDMVNEEHHLVSLLRYVCLKQVVLKIEGISDTLEHFKEVCDLIGNADGENPQQSTY